MSIELINSDLNNIKKEIKTKFSQQQLSDIDVTIKMIELDTDFVLHVQINNAFEKCTSTEERLKIYLDYLKHYLKN